MVLWFILTVYLHIYLVTQKLTDLPKNWVTIGYIHTYIHTYIHNTYIHTCIHTYIHTYIHVHTYIHTYIHTLHCSILLAVQVSCSPCVLIDYIKFSFDGQDANVFTSATQSINSMLPIQSVISHLSRVMRKSVFAYENSKTQISCAKNASQRLWVYCTFCVWPGWNL